MCALVRLCLVLEGPEYLVIPFLPVSLLDGVRYRPTPQESFSCFGGCIGLCRRFYRGFEVVCGLGFRV